MEPSTLFAISIVALIIWCFLLINIIEKGSRSKQIEQRIETQSLLLSSMIEQMKMQTLLLSNIAAKQGVGDDVIQQILKPEVK